MITEYETKAFLAKDLIEITGREGITKEAQLNQSSGPAYSVWIPGYKAPVACGGIRYHGVGEAWSCFREDIDKKLILTVTREQMERMCRENNIWQLFAATEAETWMSHLGFTKTEQRIFLR